MTVVAPLSISGMVMGVWFLSTSVVIFIGGRVSSFYESFALPTLFGVVAAFAIAAGVILFALVRPIKRMAGSATPAARS